MVSQLLERCQAAGISLCVVGERLEYDAPDTPEADALLAEVRIWRHRIARVLAPWLPPRTVAQVDDPRPDLAGDSEAWTQLLRLAWLKPDADEPEGCFAALHYVRCAGAGLDLTQRPPLFPRFSPKTQIEGDDGERLEVADETAWSTPEEWEQTRREALVPHRESIARLLRVLAKEHALRPVERERVAV